MNLIHSVIFILKKDISKEEKQVFFEEVDALANIKGVLEFEVLRQISPKNKFEFGISMKFENQSDYDFYSNHPEHQAFVQNYWLKYVDDFLEIDYQK